jgi:hypothetical protein
MFNTFYKTIERSFPTQAVTVGTLAGAVVIIPFQQLANIGFLRALDLYSPSNTGTTVLGGGGAAVQGGLQQAQWRELNQIQINLQSTTDLYNLGNGSGGLELGYLQYVKAGDNRRMRGASMGAAYTGALSGNLFPFAFPDGQAANAGSIANGYANYYDFNTNPTRALRCKIPISEFIAWPNMPISQSQQAVLVSDSPIEMGLMLLQNNLQNITPFIKLNPVYQLTSAESPLIVTGAATASHTNVSYTLQADAYDVADDPADWPMGKQAAYAITRISKEVPISGQAATCRFIPAGLLLRVIYFELNDTTNRGTVLDMTATPATRIVLHSGSSTTLIDETAQINAGNSADRYYWPAPGIMVHDRMYDGSIVDALDTGKLTELRTDFTGLAAAGTRLRWIEERLIRVVSDTTQAAQGA